MLLGAAVIVVIALLVFNFFQRRPGQITEPAEIVEEPEVKVIEEEKPVQEKEEAFVGGLPTTHRVVAGERLWDIAEFYYQSGYNWVDLASANNLTNPNLIESGQELNIPDVQPKKTTVVEEAARPEVEAPAAEKITGNEYTVVRGDNLWNIAVRAYGDGFRWTEIAKVNNLTNPHLIHAGNVFTITR